MPGPMLLTGIHATSWIQFHEDLLARLGIPRGSDA